MWKVWKYKPPFTIFYWRRNFSLNIFNGLIAFRDGLLICNDRVFGMKTICSMLNYQILSQINLLILGNANSTGFNGWPNKVQSQSMCLPSKSPFLFSFDFALFMLSEISTGKESGVNWWTTSLCSTGFYITNVWLLYKAIFLCNGRKLSRNFRNGQFVKIKPSWKYQHVQYIIDNWLYACTYIM